MENDLGQIQEALIDDRNMLADLKKHSSKTEEYQEIAKTRQEELFDLVDTTNVLNGDDVLELCKQTVQAPSCNGSK